MFDHQTETFAAMTMTDNAAPVVETRYNAQVAVGEPPNGVTVEAYDHCATIWRPLYDGPDRKVAHQSMLAKRDSVGYPVVRVVAIETCLETKRVVSRVTETIQQRIAAPNVMKNRRGR